MKKDLFFLLLPLCILFLNACQKEHSGDLSSGPSTARLSPETVNAWLDNLVSTQNGVRNERIASIKRNLDFSRLSFEKGDGKEDYVLIPLKEGFRSAIHQDEDPLTSLALAVNKKGRVLRGQLFQYLPGEQKSAAAIPANAFATVCFDQKGSLNGRFALISIFDKLYFNVEYRNGRRVTFSEMTVKPPATASNVAARQKECREWYLVTTYYNEDGSIYSQEWDYIGTFCVCPPNELCDEFGGDNAGSGAQVPDSFKYSVSRYVVWTVSKDPFGLFTGEIKSTELLVGMKDSESAYGGYFTNVSHQSLACTFCEATNMRFGNEEIRVTADGYGAHSFVRGDLLTSRGLGLELSNSKDWTFGSVFP
jgi:hypothetical protein